MFLERKKRPVRRQTSLSVDTSAQQFEFILHFLLRSYKIRSQIRPVYARLQNRQQCILSTKQILRSQVWAFDSALPLWSTSVVIKKVTEGRLAAVMSHVSNVVLKGAGFSFPSEFTGSGCWRVDGDRRKDFPLAIRGTKTLATPPGRGDTGAFLRSAVSINTSRGGLDLNTTRGCAYDETPRRLNDLKIMSCTCNEHVCPIGFVWKTVPTSCNVFRTRSQNVQSVDKNVNVDCRQNHKFSQKLRVQCL